jgi:hypothetical protein
MTIFNASLGSALQRLRLIPRRGQPDLAVLGGRQDHWHRLWMVARPMFGAVIRKPRPVRYQLGM